MGSLAQARIGSKTRKHIRIPWSKTSTYRSRYGSDIVCKSCVIQSIYTHNHDLRCSAIGISISRLPLARALSLGRRWCTPKELRDWSKSWRRNTEYSSFKCDPRTSNLMPSKFIAVLPPSVRLSNRSSKQTFSVLHRPSPNYNGHVPLTILERGAIAAGSAIMSLVNPRRGGKFGARALIPNPH